MRRPPVGDALLEVDGRGARGAGHALALTRPGAAADALAALPAAAG